MTANGAGKTTNVIGSVKYQKDLSETETGYNN